jgi:hypothetical protein
MAVMISLVLEFPAIRRDTAATIHHPRAHLGTINELVVAFLILVAYGVPNFRARILGTLLDKILLQRLGRASLYMRASRKCSGQVANPRGRVVNVD